jgi:hypothetical protein
MSKPLVVSIPHSLGKEEAMRRLRSGLSRAATSIPLMKVDEETWTGNRMSFRGPSHGPDRGGNHRRGRGPRDP